MIPSSHLLKRYPRQTLDPAVVRALSPGFPKLGPPPPLPQEIVLQHGSVPPFDCGQFALGTQNAQWLMPELLPLALREFARRFGMLPVASLHGTIGTPDSPVIAVYAKQGKCGSGTGLVVQHVALGHLDAKGELPAYWSSKLGPSYPAMEHFLSQLEGGAYGEVAEFVVPAVCGDPHWLSSCPPP
jgi:hypothetical protein